METIWVGEVEGKVLVYDPTIQLPNCPHLFLWSPDDASIGKYIANGIRARIKRFDHPDAEAHAKAYQGWRASYGAEWLGSQRLYYENRQVREAQEEEERLERERLANLTPAERHKERLERLGKPYLGVRPATENPLRRRVTHCYSCKSPLDNSIDIECVSCGWILCSCGACGCGYDGLA